MCVWNFPREQQYQCALYYTPKVYTMCILKRSHADYCVLVCQIWKKSLKPFTCWKKLFKLFTELAKITLYTSYILFSIFFFHYAACNCRKLFFSYSLTPFSEAYKYSSLNSRWNLFCRFLWMTHIYVLLSWGWNLPLPETILYELYWNL